MAQTTAPRGLDQWVDDLKDKPLPVLIRTVQQLRRLFKEPDLSLQQLVPVIRQDPVFNLHLVRLANTLSRNKETEVNTPELAAATLGLDHIRDLCDRVPVIAINHASVPHKQYLRAVGNSYHAAVQAQSLCRFASASVIADTRMAAMFYGVGHWALWRYAPAQMSAIKVRIYEDDEDVVLAEDDVLGCTIQQLSEALIRTWGLSRLAAEALRHATSPDAGMLESLHQHAENHEELDEARLRQVKQLHNATFYPVKLANWLALTVPYGWGAPKALRLVELIADFLQQPLGQVASELHQRCSQASREHQVSGLMSPAALMLLLSSDLVLSYRLGGQANAVGGTASLARVRAERQRRLQREAKVRPPGMKTTPGGDSSEEDALRDTAILHRITQALAQPDQYRTPLGIYTDLLEGLGRGVGLARISLLEVSTEGELRPLAQAGIERSHPLARFTLSLKVPSLFKKLAHTPSAVWLGDHNREKIWPELPERFKQHCHPRSFVLISLLRKGRVCAYLYADAGLEEAVTAARFRYFKQLCGAANRCLNLYQKEDHALTAPAGGAGPADPAPE